MGACADGGGVITLPGRITGLLRVLAPVRYGADLSGGGIVIAVEPFIVFDRGLFVIRWDYTEPSFYALDLTDAVGRAIALQWLIHHTPELEHATDDAVSFAAEWTPARDGTWWLSVGGHDVGFSPQVDWPEIGIVPALDGISDPTEALRLVCLHVAGMPE